MVVQSVSSRLRGFWGLGHGKKKGSRIGVGWAGTDRKGNVYRRKVYLDF